MALNVKWMTHSTHSSTVRTRNQSMISLRQLKMWNYYFLEKHSWMSQPKVTGAAPAHWLCDGSCLFMMFSTKTLASGYGVTSSCFARPIFLNERHQLDETWNVYLMTEINFILGKFEKIARQLTWNRVDWTVNHFRRYKVLSNMSGISIWKIISQFIRRMNGQICWVKHAARHGRNWLTSLPHSKLINV